MLNDEENQPGNLEFRNGYPVLAVKDAIKLLNQALNDIFPFIWVRGELSGIKRSQAGHYYFLLKDEEAQLACVCFRPIADKLKFTLQDGQQVLCGGVLEVYRDRGTLQLIVKQAQPEGVGALALAFEQLKQKLQAEGLFASERKRPLPALPKLVGIVTSKSGAVIRDILTVSARRHPGINILISPTRVQGDGAEHEIAAALLTLQAHQPDVIIVARGGGSLEDLWCFNTEIVARAVYNCPVPVVSAVGHETDFTICDFVADVRAPTPSAAAELVFPDRSERLQQVGAIKRRLFRQMLMLLAERRQRLNYLEQALPHPWRHLDRQRQRLDERNERLQRALRMALSQRHNTLASWLARLEAVNPVRVLNRGYVMVELNGQPLSSASNLSVGQRLSLRFRDGLVKATVEHIESKQALKS